jgi:hypothetical protein
MIRDQMSAALPEIATVVSGIELTGGGTWLIYWLTMRHRKRNPIGGSPHVCCVVNNRSRDNGSACLSPRARRPSGRFCPVASQAFIKPIPASAEIKCYLSARASTKPRKAAPGLPSIGVQVLLH